MNLNSLNLITVLLVVLKIFGFISVSWWLVFSFTFIWLAVFILVITIALTIMAYHRLTIDEFNELMSNNKKNK